MSKIKMVLLLNSFVRKMYISEEQQQILELHHLGDVRMPYWISCI